MQRKKAIFFLVIILAIAAFFRFWQLESIPPGLWPDEAINANTALQIHDTGKFQVFYPENHGREGLFFLLVSLAFFIFGVSIWSFKIVSAIAGILTIFGLYLLTKELFSKFSENSSQTIAWLASFFLAISFWHINFSRIGFRGILLPLVLVFSFYFFFRGLRTKRVSNFLFSGLIFGLGFYTYISFRLAVFLLAFVLIFWFFIAQREKWGGKYLTLASWLLVAAFLSALPLGIYFIKNPEQFVSRALEISVFKQEEPIKEFLKSFGKHLAMFNFSGDLNWRHNLSGFPQLSPLVGVFFLIGIFYSLHRLIFSKSRLVPSNRISEIFAYSFLIIWLLVMILPGALTIEGVPHALRTIGVIPAAYIFAGLGAWLLYHRAKNKLRGLKIISFSLLALMILSSFITYFMVWAKSPELENAFALRFLDVGKELNALPVKTKKYVVTNEGELPSEVPKFIQRTAGRDEAIYINPREIETIDFSPGDFIFIMNKEFSFLDPIKERYPQGVLFEKERILIFEVR